MDINTVAANLRNTIAGKEKLLDTLEKRASIERASIDQIAFLATVNFLKVNIDELRRILADVDACATEDSWRTNPDRSGGQFTEDEINN